LKAINKNSGYISLLAYFTAFQSKTGKAFYVSFRKKQLVRGFQPSKQEPPVSKTMIKVFIYLARKI